ncbi:hypothetical protein PoB_001501000 [Plakobranchus ocellatus]|uniref:Secreted protein n=1 Tax=Plakobranchus ocellatus TaxID=259542 RepID=A0AAV3YZA4_9GAST|nr:hypothetical protein PoB_001501000 [Plakobranchus ocellatus]
MWLLQLGLLLVDGIKSPCRRQASTVDTEIFKAHRTRAASTSTVARHIDTPTIGLFLRKVVQKSVKSCAGKVPKLRRQVALYTNSCALILNE